MVSSTLSNISIGAGSPRCQVTWGHYHLCAVSPKMTFFILPPTRGRMDSAGFEPASATRTECCVPITPRALRAVSVTASAIARVRCPILPCTKLGENIAETEVRGDRVERREASVFLCCKNFSRRNNGVAVNRDRVLQPARIASGVSHHHWNVSCLTHSEYQFVAALEPFKT